MRRLAHALNVEYCEAAHHSPEMVIHKAEELVQEVNRLRTKSTNVETQLTGVEVDFRTCRDALDRATTEKEQLQRQLSVQLVDIERLRQARRSEYYWSISFKTNLEINISEACKSSRCF